ncbi:MAG TPA: Rieske 2Fe-2S domain-containing protein [Chloroflexota bacterium]|nr:Rieske 2Fe-2S domain-containing protein [Chloroflexota bacterium]
MGKALSVPYHWRKMIAPVEVAPHEFVHTGPGTLGGRFLRMFWQPVYLLAGLRPGRAAPLRIMGEDFTVYRGEGGAPHVVAFRCAHRGTQLSTGWVEGDQIRCFYHGWKYDQTGQCVEQPAEDEGFAAKIRIRAYPTVEYLGLVFAYLGEGEAPPFPRYPQLEAEGVLETHGYIRECSYFNSIENNMDEVHIAFVHRSSSFTASGLNRFLPEISGQETDYGIIRYGSRPNGVTRVLHLVMPNLIVFQGVPSPEKGETQGADSFAWRVPVEDTVHRSFNLTLAHVAGEAADRFRERREQQKQLSGPPINELAESALRGDVHVDTFGARPDAVNIQDVVAQVGQGRIPERANDRLGRSDILVILLRKIFQRELQALAEGRPTKRWIQPERLEAAFGI